MAEDKLPYIDPNSGAASQPGGVVAPGEAEYEPEPDMEEVVKTQIQDDPSGPAAVDPDARVGEPEDDDADPEGGEGDQDDDGTNDPEVDASDLEERTGEAVTGEGDVVVTAQEADGQVASTVPGEGTIEATGDEAKPEDQTAPKAGEFDAAHPENYTVVEIVQHLEEHPEDKDAIVRAEKALAKPRKSIAEL